MKVGIVTLIGNNYGGMLQAYALNTVLKNEKCNVEVLNYNNLNRNEKNIGAAYFDTWQWFNLSNT